MALITLKTSTAVNATQVGVANSNVSLDIVGIPQEQLTLPVGATVRAGAAVRIDVNGKFVEADGTTAGNADIYGIAIRRAVVGQAVTAIKRGILGGFDFTSQAFNGDIFVSDTAGSLGDAAGTSSKKVGKVVPIHSQVRGGTPLKALLVNL